MQKIKFIDLFAGLGGTRLGFEQACQELGIKTLRNGTIHSRYFKGFLQIETFG